jgi:hypothetical protein
MKIAIAKFYFVILRPTGFGFSLGEEVPEGRAVLRRQVQNNPLAVLLEVRYPVPRPFEFLTISR